MATSRCTATGSHAARSVGGKCQAGSSLASTGLRGEATGSLARARSEARGRRAAGAPAGLVRAGRRGSSGHRQPRLSVHPDKFIPVVARKLSEAKQSRDCLMSLDFRNVRYRAVGCLIAPIREEARCALKRTGNRPPCLRDDAFDHLMSPARGSVHGHGCRFVSTLSDCHGEQDRLGCSPAHRTASQIGAELVAVHRFVRSLQKSLP